MEAVIYKIIDELLQVSSAIFLSKATLCSHGCKLAKSFVVDTDDVHNRLDDGELKYSDISVNMLVLYETSLGFCLFKLSDSARLKEANLWDEFETPEKANNLYAIFHACAFPNS